MTHKLLAVAMGLSLAAAGPARADWHHNPDTANWYCLTSPGTWTDAEDQAIALGGHLVAIGDQQENDWLVSVFGEKGNATRKLWIGLYQLPESLEPDGGWVWSNGEPVIYTHWGQGEPNDKYDGEDFTHMWDQNATPGTDEVPGCWNDYLDAGQSCPGIVESDIPEPATPSLLAFGGLVPILSAIRRRGNKLAST